MQPKKVLPAILLVWVWLLLWDNFLSGPIMGNALATIPGLVATFPKMWEVVGDLCAAVVLVWFYSRVQGAFGTGIMGGLKYGLSAGVLINFPTWLFMTLYLAWPYAPTWHITLIAILQTGVSGLLAGLVFEKMGGGAAA